MLEKKSERGEGGGNDRSVSFKNVEFIRNTIVRATAPSDLYGFGSFRSTHTHARQLQVGLEFLTFPAGTSRQHLIVVCASDVCPNNSRISGDV